MKKDWSVVLEIMKNVGTFMLYWAAIFAGLTLIWFVSLWLTGCASAPTATPTVRDVAGDLSQTIEQQMGVEPGALLVAGAAVTCFLVGAGLALVYMEPPRSLKGKVITVLLTLSFLAVGFGLAARLW